MRMEGKVALITGAAAGVEGELMGFGGASAHLFTREGAKVVLTDILVEQGERSAAQLGERGYDATFMRLDVTSEDDWQEAIARTVETYGKLDVLVNNAGLGGSQAIEQTDVEQWDAMMDSHAKGAFLGMKYGIPEIRKAGGGSVVNISSIYGIVGSAGGGAYHAAKGAIRTLTKAAAVQYAKDGIRVNSVHPGFAMTPMTARSHEDPEQTKDRISKTPLGRLGDAYDIAYGILYLASDESSFVTGAELVIDGGMTAQ